MSLLTHQTIHTSMLLGYCFVSSVLLSIVQGESNYTCITKVPVLTCTDTLPANVSIETSTVILQPFTRDMVLTNLTFEGEGWGNVIVLEVFSTGDVIILLKSNCFTRLHSLKRLRIQVRNPIFETKVFYGLKKLVQLELSDAINLSEKQLFENLNGKVLWNLRRLFLWRVGTNVSEGYVLDEWFWKYVSGTKLRVLYINFMKVKSFNITSFYAHCYMLDEFNMVGTNVTTAQIAVHGISSRTVCTKRPRIGITRTTIVKTLQLWCPMFQSNPSRSISAMLRDSFMFSSIQQIENMCEAMYSIIAIDELYLPSGIKMISKNMWNITSLLLKRNNITTFATDNFISRATVSQLFLSNNKLVFLSADTLSNISSLQYLDLSYNYLHEMNGRFKSEFERVLFSLDRLQHIILKRNFLTIVPEKMFLYNLNLQTIDLSDNLLSQITFKINHLKHLNYLNMRKNQIRTLDHPSMLQVDNLFSMQTKANATSKVVVKLSYNPLNCSSCRSYTFITWLQKRRIISENRFKFLCFNENGTTENVINKTFPGECHIKDVYVTEGNEENKKFIVAGLILLPALVLLSAKVIMQYLDRRRKVDVIEDIVNRLNAGHKQCEYVVFVAFSGEDELFINTNVIPQLTDNLQSKLGEAAFMKPLCTGDTMFRVGKYIHEEIMVCLDNSMVMLVLLTNNYCRSRYCMMEFQQALCLDKPVVFMIKDKLDETLMAPAMRQHYNNNARILWAKERDEYVLKSTWTRICESIIELASK